MVNKIHKSNGVPLLEIQDLKIHFYINEGIVQAVDGVNLKIYPNTTLGLVGESGCGKTVTALTILRLIPTPPGKIVSGAITYRRKNQADTVDLCKLNPTGTQIRNIRGGEIAMVFQEPMTSLNPVLTIGDQISEMVMVHQRVNEKEARKRAIEMLTAVEFPNPIQRIDEYPHHLSGGLRQRVMIGMALSCNPSILIADEPTTALDVTTQAQILELMKGLQKEFGMSIIFITHDLGVIYEISDYVAIMYLGQVVEYSDVNHIFDYPKHPYTKALLRSMPVLGPRVKERLHPIEGIVPSPINLKKGCRFYSRCNAAGKENWHGLKDPPYVEIEQNHWVRCWLYEK